MKCPNCKFESSFVYIGAIHVECPNENCKYFDNKVREAWLQAQQTPVSNAAPLSEDEQEMIDAYSAYLGGLMGDDATD